LFHQTKIYVYSVTDRFVDIVVVSTCHMNVNIHLGGAITNDIFTKKTVSDN